MQRINVLDFQKRIVVTARFELYQNEFTWSFNYKNLKKDLAHE